MTDWPEPEAAALCKPAPAGETFHWRGQELPYLDHPYNTTILNERCIEVPIATRWLEEQRGTGLEVGNVLSHYYDGGYILHRVIDLYEEAHGVENVDVLAVTGEYDWILAVSTLEHVRQGTKDARWGPLGAIRRLHNCLNRGGEMLITIPFGQNPWLDVAILDGKMPPPTTQSTMVLLDDGSWTCFEGVGRWDHARENGWARAVWIATWKK